jgi:hypothetical protein
MTTIAITHGLSHEETAGQDTTKTVEGQQLPNLHCKITMHDDLVYKTRFKQYVRIISFEAGTQRFLSDYWNTIVRVQVRNAWLVQTVYLRDSETDTKS